MYSCGPFHIDKQDLDDQLELIDNSSELKLDVAWITNWKFPGRYIIIEMTDTDLELSILIIFSCSLVGCGRSGRRLFDNCPRERINKNLPHSVCPI